ncbi:hypothetical protein HF847_04910 [Clostridium cochlearium]|nr:hypothetical protein [Clostridium cochlearium]
MNKKSFKTINGLELVVKNRKSAVIFEIGNNHEENNFNFSLIFNFDTFKDLFEHLKEVSNKSWNNIKPREADSLGADYDEYYDRQLDNNGCLAIRENMLLIERPALESNKLYQFNKRKMESFLYDFRKIIIREE